MANYDYRDNGIVLSISMIQWLLEVINLINYLVFFFFFNGWSKIIDKLYNIFIVSFYAIFQPAFYLNGDFRFRRNLDNKGFIEAFRLALLYPR